VSWHVAALNLDNLGDLPKRCRNCVFWELSSRSAEQADGYGTADLEKEAWLSEVLLEWGSCGRVVYVAGAPAGYVVYAPPASVPRAAELPTGPVSADAVLLTTMQVMPEFSGEGVGRMLAQTVVKDLTRRGVRAVEVFGDASPGTDADCVVPAEFLRAVGFKTVRPHHRWPRLRMELRSGLEWKEDVEAALEQLFNTVTIPLQGAAPVEQRTPAKVGRVLSDDLRAPCAGR
jgi:GNAT superfamily N-acetyltransferase